MARKEKRQAATIYAPDGHESVEVITVPLWHHKRGLMFTSTGYGSKIPTEKMIIYNGRKYRVYCHIYSNSGTLYIISKGEKIVVDWMDDKVATIKKLAPTKTPFFGKMAEFRLV